jgi:transposase
MPLMVLKLLLSAHQNRHFMNVYLAKFMTYYEIHRMHREGHSISKTSEYLALNRRTVSKYLSMNEQEYEEFLTRQSNRQKKLLPYENFVRKHLKKFRDTPAAQMHDWLKEHHQEFPVVSQKTVFNFVSWVREQHRLPILKTERQYQQAEETLYGKQAQVDFGEYNIRTTTGRRTKVFFFTFVLSRSRYKYVWFTDRHFTAEIAIEAHEKAFEYIGGIPNQIVYDQDTVFIVSENGGDIILTDAFRAYTRDQSFDLYFCRKADPESKGKVENVVKYVKQNFLCNRTYHNIETLNDQAMGWLGRTANSLPHGTTKKEPFSELIIEQAFLKPYQVHTGKRVSITAYSVRKDNTISFKGNFYSLPLGTYRGKGTLVAVRVDGSNLIISVPAGDQEICRHKIPPGRGNKVSNTDHKRDKSTAIQEMIQQVAALFQNTEQATLWFDMIKADKPRYIRDQLNMIKDTALQTAPDPLNEALDYCFSNRISSASDFRSILSAHLQTQNQQTKIVQLNPLSGQTRGTANIKPDKSSIKDYQSILKKSSKE